MTSSANDDGAWVFVSHSHKDIKMVRQVRNELERHGHQPLMFYLKCLEDDQAQLPYLLRKEIEARTWFVLCDSPNSRESRWVQEEKDIVKSIPGKVYKEVDISGDPKVIKSKIAEIAKRAKVFLSYTSKDRPIAKKIADSLRLADFQVYSEVASPVAGWDSTENMRNAIDLAVEKGFFLTLLSPDSLKSEFVASETRHALEKAQHSEKSNVIPILLRDRSEVLFLMPKNLTTLRYFDFTTGDFEKNIDGLISSLKQRKME